MEIAFSSRELRDTCSQYLKLKQIFGFCADTFMSILEDIRASSSFVELKVLLSVPYFFQSSMSPERLIIKITDSIQLAFVANNSYGLNNKGSSTNWDYVTHLKLVEVLDDGVQYAKFSA
ncbi:hypothetical protein AAEU28_11860 [Pseudoalteromonas sp. SS15]|uniref:hypothetical protein n=1 Tax=Pseudoalteromonas sp. SS15 TaxID=3139393 RepID=UPI003BAD4BCB